MTDAGRDDDRSGELAPGAAVEIRRKLDGQWARGFEIIDREDGDSFRVRRMSDGQELPVPISGDDLRPQRKRSTWWY
jgi:hypothetical protein